MAKVNRLLLKNKIVIVLPSDIIIFLFIDSGAFDLLNKHYHVHFIVNPLVKKSVQGDKTTINLSKKFLFLNKYLGNLFWYTSLFNYNLLRKISHQHSFKIMQQPPVWRFIYQILSYPPFNNILKWLDENIFFRNDFIVESYLKSINPQLLIFPGSALDSYSHIVARTASKCKIPSLMIIAHWDFFSKKSVLRFSPEKIYVWGEDMRKMALFDKSLNANIIEVLGSPNLDKYKHLAVHDSPINSLDFGIPSFARIILFAGTSVPYDEVSILQRINTYLEKNNIQNIYIIYRPHPRGWLRKSNATENPANMKFVKIDIPKSTNEASHDHYIKLLSIVDGMISPFSTMILEGALCNKLVLCMNFSDSINEFDFSILKTTDHLQCVKNKPWITICEKSEDLEEQLVIFLSKLDSIKSSAKVSFDIKDIVYYDDHPYSVRLHSRIQKDFFN